MYANSGLGDRLTPYVDILGVFSHVFSLIEDTAGVLEN